MAAFWSGRYLLQEAWQWAKENMTTDEIRNKLLLATDSDGENVWHVAAKMGELDLLQEMWEWAKENMTTNETKNMLFLEANKDAKPSGTL